MAKQLGKQDKVMPCLLDRLIDDQPHMRTGDRMDIYTGRYLKAAILRDLSWLLNSKSKVTTHELEGAPEASSSVLNYGIEDLCGKSFDGTDLHLLEDSIKASIVEFEPRLDPDSVAVHIRKSEADHSMSSFDVEIRGTVRATPVPEELVIHSLVDAETGRFELWS